MDIDCLQTFLAVARLESFTQAAGVRHLTQPAVSRQIRRLEEDLGVKLFVQTGRRVSLTAEGRVLHAEGARVIGQIHGVRTALAELGELRRGELRIGASSTPGTYLLPGILAGFRAEYPGVGLHYELSNSRAIENGVVHNDLDLGFVGERLDTVDTATETFAEDSICLIASPTHAFALRKAVSLDDILAEQYVAREEGSGTRRTFESWLARQGRSWRPLLELGSIEAVKHAVAAGLGIAAVSRVAIDWEVQARRLVIVRAKAMSISRELFVLYRKDVRLSAAASVFLAMARAVTGKPKRLR
jgi:DNA-binding transcriptional LysR family regulator